MSLRVRLWCACALTAVAFGSMGIHAQKGPALADLRRAAADYVAEYFHFRTTVNYATEPKLGLWLPLDMYQQVEIGSVVGVMSDFNTGGGSDLPVRQSFEARAKYSKFRQVSVGLTRVK